MPRRKYDDLSREIVDALSRPSESHSMTIEFSRDRLPSQWEDRDAVLTVRVSAAMHPKIFGAEERLSVVQVRTGALPMLAEAVSRLSVRVSAAIAERYSSNKADERIAERHGVGLELRYSRATELSEKIAILEEVLSELRAEQAELAR